MKGMKKPLALLLALVMAFSLLSVGAWADEEEAPAEEAAFIDLGGEEAIPETPAEEPAEAPEEESAPAEEPAEAPEEEAVLLDGETSDESATGNVAKVGDIEYETLQAAVNAVGTSGKTVTLLQDAQGDGIKFAEGSKVTIDFNGHTYTVLNTVGSTGTETNGFQLLKTSVITLKNGSLYSPKAIILLQNYSNLTLEDMNLDMSEASQVTYVASNNFGSLTVKGNTVIKAAPGQCAFDLWYGMNKNGLYDDGVTVTFGEDFTGTVSGKVEYGRAGRAANMDWMDKTKLNINSPNGTFDVTLVSGNGGGAVAEGANISIQGGTFTNVTDAQKYLAEGYAIDANGTVYKDTAALEFTPAEGEKVTYYASKIPTTWGAGTYKLLADVTVSETINVPANATLDLNGKALTSNAATKALDVNGTGVTVQLITSAAGGKLIKLVPDGAQAKNSKAILVQKTNNNFTIGEGVAILADGQQGISVWDDGNTLTIAKGASVRPTSDNANNFLGVLAWDGYTTPNTINISGVVEGKNWFAISTNGSETGGTKNAIFNIYDGAEVTSDSVAVYLPGGGEFNMTGGMVKGSTGIYNKCAKLNITGGTVEATGENNEYKYNGNGCEDVGDAIVMDNCGTAYKHGTPEGGSISGNVTIKSAQAAAVASYASNKDTNGADCVRVINFIAKGVTLNGEIATNPDLLKENLRVDADGKVVENKATVATATATTDAEATYTVTPQGAGTITVDVQADADADGNKVDVASVNVAGLLAELAEAAGDDALQAKEGGSNAEVKLEMSAEQTPSSAAGSLSFEIHPAYSLNGGAPKKLDNRFVTAPITVTLKNIIPTGKTFSKLWHKLASGVWQEVTATALEGGKGITFTTSSFSEWKVELKSMTDEEKEAIKSATLTLGAVTPKGTTAVELDKGTSGTIGTDTTTITVSVKAETAMQLTAYELNLTIPEGLTVVSNTIPYTTMDTEDITTATRLTYDRGRGNFNNASTVIPYESKSYLDLDGSKELVLGVITVKANTDAVYDNAMTVKVEGTFGKSEVTGQTTAGAATSGPIKLMKRWTVTWAELYNGETKINPDETTEVGHNKAPEHDTPVRDGYQFKSWSSTFNSSTKTTADTTYTAQWEAIEYTITFVDTHTAQGQNFVLTDVKAQKGSETKAVDSNKQLKYTIEDTLSGAITKTAYTFNNFSVAETTSTENIDSAWTSTTSFGESGLTGMWGNVTITVDWTPIDYQITWGAPTIGGVELTNVSYDGVAPKIIGEGESAKPFYNIENGLKADPTRTGYKFLGWLATAFIEGSGWANAEYDGVTELGKGLYDEVTLTPVFVIDANIALLDYTYTNAGDALLMVATDTTQEGSTLKFQLDEDNNRDFFKTTNANYLKAFKEAAGLTESDTVSTVYVTIVTNTWGTGKLSEVNKTAIARLLSFQPDADGYEEVKYNGDVIAANGEIKPDGTVSLADLSNTDDMLAGQNIFKLNEIGILGRLNADIDNANDTVTGTGDIKDLVKIMEAMYGANASGN